MAGWIAALLIAIAAEPLAAVAAAPRSIRLHPENPHYFLWRERPVVLIGISDDYGAVLDLGVDYQAYLDTIAADRANITRVMSGVLVEAGDPQPGRFLPPWQRSETPGYANGGNKFDLGRLNPEYFARLRGFVAEAGQRGIVVQFMLFSPLFDAAQWRLCPFNPANNVNDIAVTRHEVYTIDRNPRLLAIQETFARRVVTELRRFDNVIYEISYSRHPELMSLDWERHMTRVVFDAKKKSGDSNLVSLGLNAGQAPGEQIDGRVSVLNHMHVQPSVVADNAGQKRAIGLSEIGFEVSTDAAVRMRAWDFVMAGGGLFVQMNMGFSPADPKGLRISKSPVPEFASGPLQRRQLRSLVEFMSGLDFIHMRPAPEVLAEPLPGQLGARVLMKPGSAALYVRTKPTPHEVSVRWSGRIVPRYSEEYTLTTRATDGVRLWIDGRPLIDRRAEKLVESAAKVRMAAGKPHDVRVEFYGLTVNTRAQLLWQSASQPREIIPASRLSTPDGEAGGLLGEHFAGTRFEGKAITRKDPTIDWKVTKSPLIPGPYSGKLVVRLGLPAGQYRIDWVAPATAAIASTSTVRHKGGPLSIEAPAFADDIAAKVVRK